MNRQQFRTRARGAVLLMLGLTLGGIAASAHVGQAAGAAAPANSAPPTISGTPTLGSRLTAANGTWTGSEPITYTYRWRRCDTTGGSCSNISGATGLTYTLTQVDVGNTLRVTVTAKNSTGSDSSTSVPTAVVTAPPAPAPTGCPSGTGTIAIGDLSLPARLNIDDQSLSPAVVGRRTAELTTRIHVSACGGRSVSGALVYVTAVPFNQYSVPAEATTGSDGWATLTMSQQGGFPASRQQQLLALFVRARKAADPDLGGVSTRRLISFPVNLAD